MLIAAALLAGLWGLRPLFPALAAAPREEAELVLAGRVIRVIDGDTLEVALDSGPERIRLYGVDAPEARAPGGREATQALRRLVAVGAVELQPVSDDPRDAYDRLVAVVYAGGANVNERLLADGHAWAYRRYLGQLDGDRRYCELEAAARAGRRGFWSLPAERWVPPWIWRERQKAPPGAAVPSRDYAGETAAACSAAIGQPHGAGGSGSLSLPAPGASTAPATSGAGSAGHRAGCDIKGNINRKGQRIYHLPGTEHYVQTQVDPAQGERWFCSEEQARAAGWRAAR